MKLVLFLFLLVGNLVWASEVRNPGDEPNESTQNSNGSEAGVAAPGCYECIGHMVHCRINDNTNAHQTPSATPSAFDGNQ